MADELRCNQKHLRAEAERIASTSWAAKKAGYDVIDPNEIVTPQPEYLYRVPYGLCNTTSACAVAELAELFNELRLMNERFVGWKTLEAHGYLTITGEAEELAEDIRRWLENYLPSRAHDDRLTSKTAGASFRLAFEVLKKLYGLLGSIAFCKGTIHSCVLNYGYAFAVWFVCDRRISPYMLDFAVALHTNQNAVALHTKMQQQARLVEAVRNRLGREAEEPIFRNAAHLTEATLRQQLAAAANDIHFLRAFFVGLSPPESVVQITARLWAGWKFVSWDGGVVGWVMFGDSPAKVESDSSQQKSPCLIGVHRSGVFTNYNQPWVRVDQLSDLAIAYPILDAVRDHLLKKYADLDFEEIRQRASQPNAAPEDIERTVGQTVIDLAKQVGENTELAAPDGPSSIPLPQQECVQTEPTSTVRPRIPSLKYTVLARLLEEKCGCEVRPGKGSEIVLYRPGGHHFRLGHHRAEFRIHPNQLRPILARLGISVVDWLRVCG